MTAVLGIEVLGSELLKSLLEAIEILLWKKDAGSSRFDGFQKTSFFEGNDWFAASHGFNGGEAEIFMLGTDESLTILVKGQKFLG